jgi:hypothetical protein
MDHNVKFWRFPMKILLRWCAGTSLLALLALPVIVNADDAENYDKDAEYAEGTPPMIPHRITDTSNGEYCLGCHLTGINGAPFSPHPIRLTCTECHGQGEIKETTSLKKGKKKK